MALPAAIVYVGAVASDLVYENRETVRTALNSAASSVYDHTPESVRNNQVFQKFERWLDGF